MLRKIKNVDKKLLTVSLLIILLGLIMILSASSIFSAFSPKLNNNPFYIFQKRLIGLLIAFTISIPVFLLPYKRLKLVSYPLLIITIIGLLFVLLPGLGVKISNASRWFKIGRFTFQISELAKLSIILFLATFFGKQIKDTQIKYTSFIFAFILVSIIIALIYIEPDFGTSVQIFLIFIFISFIAGAKLKYLFATSFFAILLSFLSIYRTGYQYSRLVGFLNPFKLYKDEGYQLVQSVIALGKGGIFGVGLGNSFQKLFYLPQSYSDFIFSIIGEELGFVGAITTIILYGLLTFYGFRIAQNAPDNFSKLLVYGIIFHLILQAILNMGVCIGILPSKGLTLPFVSAGLSAFLINTLEIAIVLNVSTYKKAISN